MIAGFLFAAALGGAAGTFLYELRALGGYKPPGVREEKPVKTRKAAKRKSPAAQPA